MSTLHSIKLCSNSFSGHQMLIDRGLRTPRTQENYGEPKLQDRTRDIPKTPQKKYTLPLGQNTLKPPRHGITFRGGTSLSASHISDIIMKRNPEHNFDAKNLRFGCFMEKFCLFGISKNVHILTENLTFFDPKNVDPYIQSNFAPTHFLDTRC